MLFAVALGLIGLTSCEKSNGSVSSGVSSGGSGNESKSAVSLLDDVIGQEYASAKKAVEKFGIPFWEGNGDEYVFMDGESDTSVPVVRLFVANGSVYRATYELENAGNVASCDKIITTWLNKLNNHKIGEHNVYFTYATNEAEKIVDFSKLPNFIKNSIDCNVYFNVGEENPIGHIIINKEYEDNTSSEDFYWSILTYEWKN